MTEAEFEKIVGRPPELDDMERTNCPKAGQICHFYCGICPKCGKPRFVCGHQHGKPDPYWHDNT